MVEYVDDDITYTNDRKRKPNQSHNWKSDSDYWKLNANNLNFKGHVRFDKEVVLKSDRVAFNNPTYFNNDIYLHGNSLKFNYLDKTKINSEVFTNNMMYVNELNTVFSDELYSIEQDSFEELANIGIKKQSYETEECNYFDKNKDQSSCKNTIWKALRKKEISADPVCNCCCSPDTDTSNCIVQLIKKSFNDEPYTLQLKTKDSIIYTMSRSGPIHDDIVQISLHKSDDIKTCKLLFFKVEKRIGDDDSSGLVKIIFQDDFNSNIIKFPDDVGRVLSIKLIIE